MRVLEPYTAREGGAVTVPPDALGLDGSRLSRTLEEDGRHPIGEIAAKTAAAVRKNLHPSAHDEG